MLYFLIITQFFLTVYLILKFRNLRRSIHKAQDKSALMRTKMDRILHELNLSFETAYQNRKLPLPLLHVPLADESGIVTAVKTVKLPSAKNAYNASIVKDGSGYLLFFRYDHPNSLGKGFPHFANIGCIGLGTDFTTLDIQHTQIDTDSEFSEDARVFENGGKHYLLFNDLIHNSKDSRGMCIAPIDLRKRNLRKVTSLNLNLSKIEKNWTPFSYDAQIHFLYSIYPQKIYSLPHLEKNDLISIDSVFSDPQWPKMWGPLRGGTPAILTDGQYLAFFHSSFEDCNGVLWYIMGAYTFEPIPPFRISAISPHPILYKGIYGTDHLPMANPKVRSIYPTGFVLDHDADLIHLSCGENDSAIKIITMDKNVLLKSLKPTSLLAKKELQTI